MGISGLEKFCISNKAIAQKIDIRDEIAKWRREHGDDPTIIIDVKELVRVLGDRCSDHSFARGLRLGGQFRKFNEILEYFFDEMKKAGANLLFVARLNEGRYRDFPNRWESSTLYPNERLLYNLMQVCSKYGQVSVYYRLGKRSILSYAREHRNNVMALITRNAPFLVYDIDFSLWCLCNVDFFELKIVKICPKQMLQAIALNSKQMQLVRAICKLDKSVKFRLLGKQCSKLAFLVERVKLLEFGENGFDLNGFPGSKDLTEEQRDEFEEKLNRVFAVNDYAADWNDDIYDGLILDLVNNDESFNLVLQFCKANLYFAYKSMNEKLTIQKDLLFIDIRRPGALPFIDLVISVTMKLCGIIFKDVEPDKQPKTRTVKLKRIFGEEAVEYEVDIEYPTMALPSLKELLIEEEDKSFDLSRLSLLMWLLDLSEETMSKINSSKKQMRIVLLTLNLLLTHRIITTHEADILLLTEFDGHSKGNVYVPKSFRPPPSKPNWRDSGHVDISWIQTVHKYTITYELVCHCLELCGLRKKTDLIEMDAGKFHDNMNQVKDGNNNEQFERMMASIKDIRLW
ncbi:uncharacterized protein LOC129579973 [Sitodiplosis mosellana]|uniref:uncharacterized protein LOC129579973 n=1 Tax=Sitodiplosis mosellana TaxID=263140 RepID=UPI00244419B4|nr:uncharacterized protein LOC129579973 [Sitodiplosis mosellana]